MVIQSKAIEKVFTVVLFIMLHKVKLKRFQCVNIQMKVLEQFFPVVQLIIVIILYNSSVVIFQ